MIYSRRPWLYPDFIFYLTSRGLQFKRDCDYVHNLSKDIVEKRRMMLVKLCVSYSYGLKIQCICLFVKGQFRWLQLRQDIGLTIHMHGNHSYSDRKLPNRFQRNPTSFEKNRGTSYTVEKNICLYNSRWMLINYKYKINTSYCNTK